MPVGGRHHADDRRPSTFLVQPMIWFQLAKCRLTGRHRRPSAMTRLMVGLGCSCGLSGPLRRTGRRRSSDVSLRSLWGKADPTYRRGRTATAPSPPSLAQGSAPPILPAPTVPFTVPIVGKSDPLLANWSQLTDSCAVRGSGQFSEFRGPNQPSRSGGTGRRAGLKIPYRQLCVGSTPSSGTNLRSLKLGSFGWASPQSCR